MDFAGKRVIDIGPASGFLSFHMERRGAQVVCIEPQMETFWDLVPRAGVDLDAINRGLPAISSASATPSGTPTLS